MSGSARILLRFLQPRGPRLWNMPMRSLLSEILEIKAEMPRSGHRRNRGGGHINQFWPLSRTCETS